MVGKFLLGWLTAIVVFNAGLLLGQDSYDNPDDKKPDDKSLLSFSSRISVLYQVVVDKQAMKDLEIVGSQKDAIEEICQRYANDSKRWNIEIADRSRAIDQDRSMSEEARKIAKAKIEKERKQNWVLIMEQTVSDIEAKLLPHQFKRLNQLTNQRYQLMNHANHIASVAKLLDQLEVTDKDKGQVKKELQAVEKEYNKRLEKLQLKYQQQVVMRLPERTQEKIRQMLGEFNENEK